MTTIFSQKRFWPTSKFSSTVHPSFKTKHPTIIQLPLTPLDDADMHNPTRFRGLTSKETQAFQTSIQPLTRRVENNHPSSFSQEEWSSHANRIFQQISRAYHSITATHPKAPSCTKPKRNLPKVAHPYPREEATAQRVWMLCNDSKVKWRRKIQKKQKKHLHFSLVRHRRIKKTVQDTLNPPTRDGVTLWETSEHESVASEPAQVGNIFAEAMANLGGDRSLRSCPDLVRNLTRHHPRCPKETTSLPLPEITDEWL